MSFGLGEKKISRRDFLKVAGTALATVYSIGTSELIAGCLAPQPTSTPTPTPTLSQKKSEFELIGNIFFDYNGNGIREPNKLPVANVEVRIGDRVGITNSDGFYRIKGLMEGKYKLMLGPPENYRYMCRSASEFRAISENYDISIYVDARADIGLMEGFLTLPFKRGTSYSQGIYVDLDSGSGVRDWKGGTFTFDGHRGIDYGLSEGQEIVAVASGVVVEAEDDWPNNPRVNEPNLGLMEDGNRIIIDHECGFRSIYAHLHKGLKVKPRKLTLNYTESDNLQRVERGQVIALSGNTGTKTMGPHLHFQVNRYTKHGEWGSPIDPYRDLYYGTHGNSPYSNNISLWTKDNDPQYSI